MFCFSRITMLCYHDKTDCRAHKTAYNGRNTFYAASKRSVNLLCRRLYQFLRSPRRSSLSQRRRIWLTCSPKSAAIHEQNGRGVVFSYGSTAELAQQIENGAPFDLFAAADTEHVDTLIASGKLSRRYPRGVRAGSTCVVGSGGNGNGIGSLQDLKAARCALLQWRSRHWLLTVMRVLRHSKKPVCGMPRSRRSFTPTASAWPGSWQQREMPMRLLRPIPWYCVTRGWWRRSIRGFTVRSGKRWRWQPLPPAWRKRNSSGYFCEARKAARSCSSADIYCPEQSSALSNPPRR